MIKLTKILTLLLILYSSAMSAVLFEVKSSSGSKIMEVCDDGVRFYDPSTGELLSEISATNIEFKTNSGKLRDFAVSDIGNSNKGSTGKLLKLSNQASMSGMGDSMIVYYKPKNAFRTNTILQDENLVGNGSFAAGYLNQASGEHTTAFGAYNKATGKSSIVLGTNCIASGANSVAMGDETQAIGDASIAAGYLSTSSGLYSTSFGRNTLASSNVATAFGANTQATGAYSFAAGGASVAQSLMSFVCGQYNYIEGNSNSWVDTDPLFVVGNGQNDAARSNAFEVKKNGNTYIPSLYTTTSANAKKTVLVDNQGKLCVMSAKDDSPNNADIEQLQNENNDLKTQILAIDKTTSEQDERIAKLEAMLNLLLKNNK